jgi:hypothetical protein
MRILNQDELIPCKMFCLPFAIQKYKLYNIYGNLILSAFVYGRQYRLRLLENRVLRETAGFKGEGVSDRGCKNCVILNIKIRKTTYGTWGGGDKQDTQGGFDV